jgi:hypothetical protein
MDQAPSLMHRRWLMEQRIIYVGLDVHKDTIAVALAEAGKRRELRGMTRSRTRRR